MELFALLSFLVSFIPLLVVITVIRKVGSALLNPQKGNKSGLMSKYQEFMKEVNQEKNRLSDVPDKKERSKQEISRENQRAQNLAKQRNNPYLSTNKNQYQQPKVKAQPLAARNRLQPVTKDEIVSRAYSNNNDFIQIKRQVSKRKKRTPQQRDLLEGIIYKEVLDKPRALRPYR